MNAYKHTSKDCLCLKGDPYGKGKRELTINGSSPVRIDRRQWLVLQVLAKERQAGGEYLSAAAILERIQNINEAFNTSHGFEQETQQFWPSPDTTELYAVIKKLRDTFLAGGCKKELLENAGRGKGYRLCLPSDSIIFC